MISTSLRLKTSSLIANRSRQLEFYTFAVQMQEHEFHIPEQLISAETSTAIDKSSSGVFAALMQPGLVKLRGGFSTTTVELAFAERDSQFKITNRRT
jgi:hypothetical protein